MNQDMSGPMLVFDFADEQHVTQRMVFSQPLRLITADTVDEVGPALAAIQRAVAAGYYAAGYIAYEAAPAFDAAFQVSPGVALPLLWFGVFEASESALPAQSHGKFSSVGWKPSITQEAYRHNIDIIRKAISRGETYQTNYTWRFRGQFSGDDLAYYEHLTQGHAAPYSAYLRMGRYRVLSLSPELFFRLEGRRIVTRPMKGTVKRGRWVEEDEARRSWLQASDKNRAENVMIVDLLRNDLGRIAELGSVDASRLFEIEKYPTVYQMTSTIRATVRPAITLTEIFRALFPCGSITGAPKISTMGLIAQLEDEAREVYCGAIGVIKPNGDAVFNVAIRTLFIDGESGSAQYGTGGGITWDSTSADEYAEALVKAALLTEDFPVFDLLETMKLQDGEFALLDRHLERVLKSARYFDIPVAEEALRGVLASYARRYRQEARRVRLLVSRQGHVSVESTGLSPMRNGPVTATLAKTPVSADHVFLYHKTTHRSMYETHRSPDETVFDVLLWNEAGNITEFTNGNLVVELDGSKFTPALHCGLLPGTLRAQLLDDNVIEERVIPRTDLQRATQIWFINSVRGWVPVQLVASHDDR